MHRLAAALVALFVVSVCTPAQGQIYRYTKKDGTVGYTDKLSELPRDRRAHYNRLARQRKEAEQRQRRVLGKEEMARRAAERERREVQAANLAAAERARRLKSIDDRLEGYRKRNAAGAAKKTEWQKKMKKARGDLKQLYRAYRDAEKKFAAIGVRASYTLLPGQAKERDEARAKMKALIPQIDAAIHQVEVALPEAARRAGVPPGWLR